MSISKTALRKIRAYVGNSSTGIGVSIGTLMRRSIVCMFIIILPGQGSTLTASALSDAVGEVDQRATEVSSATANLSQDVSDLIAKYKLTNAGKCALLVAGTSSTNSSSIYFVPGPTPVSALQADVIASSSITITGIMTGMDADAMGKSVSSSPVPGGRRFLLLGFNQNIVGPGNIAMVMLDTSQASAGGHILALTNFSASGPDGNAVPMCATTGVITK